MSENIKRQKQLWKLIQKGNYVKLEAFLESDISSSMELVNMRHKAAGDSVIHLSSRHGFLDLVEYFHKIWNVSLYLKNLDGKTPLHEASANGHFDVAKYLLDCDVPVDSLKISDWTPLMLACTKEGNIKVVDLLVSSGANIHLINKDGWNCFHISCRLGDVDMVNYLLNLDGLIWKTVSNNGRTPLHTAAMHGKKEVLDILMQKCDSRLDEQDSCGSTPLMEAVKGGHLHLAKNLIRNGARIEKLDNLGRNVLHIAAECGKMDVIKYLVLECHMDPNARPDFEANFSHTALDWARKEDQMGAVEVLVNLGAVG
uniref:ankyrin repeat domain-containing protein 16-like n=1 Tax=Styela clava TaxID=7725 RepID=UPI0019396824|nr:ankyrin repeat domain-containing protein 16-like [Styela clava]